MPKSKTILVIQRAILYLILLSICLLAMFPVLWALSTSLKIESQVVTFPPKWIPKPITFFRYVEVFVSKRFPIYLLNSIIVSVVSILLAVGTATLAGYSSARFTFPGKEVILFLILAATMIPGISIIIPLYILSNRMHIYDTRAVLVLVHTGWRIPISTWLMRGFFESIPSEIEEAATIDGCSWFQAFYKVSLPLVTPGLGASSILVFIYVWNDFLIGFTLTVSDRTKVATVGLYEYLTMFGVEWGDLMAAVILTILPVLLLFFGLQKWFIQGLTRGAIK